MAAVTYLAIVLLYAAAAGSNSDLAKLATGLWDKDKYRILAMLPTIAVPVVAWNPSPRAARSSSRCCAAAATGGRTRTAAPWSSRSRR